MENGGWKKWVAPAIVVPVIVALLTLGYKSMADDVEENEQQIVDLQKEKVDNATLQMMMQVQQEANKAQMDQIQKQSEQVEAALEEIKELKKN